MSNPLVAQEKDSTTAISGITILESGKAIADGIEQGSWASIAMGTAGVGLDALFFVMDPFGSIFAAGVGWLMEHVGPLKEALDALAGHPDQVQAHSETWTNVSKEIASVSADLAAQIKADVQGWSGPSADAYRAQADDVAKALDGAAQACGGAAKGVKTAGEVVAGVRMFVRDIIAQVVGSLVAWALEVVLTAGIGLAWVVPQVAALVAKTAKQIAELVKNLTKALGELGKLLGKASKLFGDAGKVFKGLKPGEAPKPRAVETSGGKTTPSAAGGAPKGEPGGAPKSEPEGAAKTEPEGAPEASGTPKDPPGETAPSRAVPEPARDGAVGKDGFVCKSDPVDVVRGNVVLDQVDLELPSPLVLERLHVSSYRAGRWFGPSWTSTVDQRLADDGEHVRYYSPDGMILVYPRAAAGAPVLPLEGPRRPLTRTADGAYILTDPLQGKEIRFGTVRGREPGEFALLAITDADGAAVDVEYDPLGAPRALRHSAGYRVELETGGGRVTAIQVVDPDRDFRVLVRRFGYDEHGRLTQVFNASGLPLLFDYDPAGRLTGWQDRNGTWYRYVYDAGGRCVRTVGDQGFYDGQFAYDVQRRVTTYTDSLGHTSEFHYNDAAQLVREVDPLGNVTASEWDRYDRLLARTDPLGRTTRYEYTDDGALTAEVRPDGSRARYQHDPDGTLTVTVTSGGQEWRRVYPSGAAPAAAAFDPSDQWGPDTTPAERDLFGRPRIVTDRAGGRSRMDWTIDGQPAGRSGPLGRRAEWRYDAEGNRVGEIGATHTRFEYGPFDLLVATVDAGGGRTGYEYDTELRLIRLTNPAGLIWRYTYDSAGRLVEETDFDGRLLRFGYDAAGQLVRSVNGLGEVTAYAYDPLGNLVERATPAGATRYAYDPFGLLVRAADAGSVVEIERDEQGRVVAETVNGRTVTYSYDSHTLHRRTPSGVDSAWTFDDAGNAVTLAVAGQVVTFRHDAAGREIERRTGGTTLTQTFDAEHQLTEQTVTAGQRVVQHRRYHYHVDGHLTAVDDAVSGPVVYGHDAAGRVTGVTTSDGADESYRYGPAGTIAHARSPEPAAGPRSYTGNRLSAAGPVGYSHDPQGRLVGRHENALSWGYAWDPLDRLTSVRTPDGTVWRYTYDPLGRRIAKQKLAAGPSGPVVAEETEFVWSGQNLVEQIHHDGRGGRFVLTWDHQPGTVRPVAQTEHLGAGVRFCTVLTDQIGAPVDLIDDHGVLAWHGAATLWGRVRPHRAGGVTTPLRFPGQYADDETGLHYNVFRYYDPGTGRYLSQDPLGLAPAPDPVAYVPNPLLDADPLGLGPCSSKPAAEDGLPPARPVELDATKVQSANPVSKLPATVTRGGGKGKEPEVPPKAPETAPKEPPTFGQKVSGYKDTLEVKSDPAVLRIPDDPNIKLGTPAKDLPDDMKHALKPGDENKTLGELMGLRAEDLRDDPEFAGSKAHDFLDMQGGAGYNPRDNAIAVQTKMDDKEIYHELGHTLQNEKGGYTTMNTNRSLLEYQNVLENENKINPALRDNYKLDGVPSGMRNRTWDQMRDDVNAMPDGPVKDNNLTMLNKIGDMLEHDPRYRPDKTAIEQNLASEYFYYPKLTEAVEM